MPQESRLPIVYTVEPRLAPEAYVDLLVRSTLAERRPIEDAEAIQGMLAHADLILTARLESTEGRLVGVARALTDYHYCTYLSDLAVDVAYHRQGIGRELLWRTHEAAGSGTMLILLAAPMARGYYPHIGMEAHDSCWIIPRKYRSSDGGSAGGVWPTDDNQGDSL